MFKSMHPSIVPVLLCSLLACAVSACVAPPPAPLYGYNAPVRRAPAKRVRETVPNRCEQPGRAVLSDSEKNRLFDEFDNWKEQRPSAAAANTAVPPPAPPPGRTASTACRVSRL